MIVESHPMEYHGYSFITLIQFKDRNLLTVVDNYNRKTVKAYVLDFCEAEQVDELTVINVANNWYDDGKPTYPISVEFSKNHLTPTVSKIYRTYAVESIVRVIGPLFSFEMDQVQKIRRKRRIIPSNVVMPLSM
jgi:hypothetical protein